MSKQKKDKQLRPDKYEQKVAINVGFNEAIQIFATHANKVVADKKTKKDKE